MVRLLLCSAALLTLLGACSWNEPQIVDRPVNVVTHVPAELRSCPGLPSVPGVSSTQADVASYVARLHQVAVTCKVRLNSVDDILTTAENPPAGG